MERCPNIDNFCYVCGHQVTKKDKKLRKNLITSEFLVAYTLYFSLLNMTNEYFTPSTVCRSCYTNLVRWLHRKHESPTPYGVPMVWAEDPAGHNKETCYACKNYTPDLNKKYLKKKKYISTQFASIPKARSPDFSPPEPPKNKDEISVLTDELSDLGNFDDPMDQDYIPDDLDNDEPQLITQSEMDFIVATLVLSQFAAEWLTSFLKKKKLTYGNVNSTAYRQRHAEFLKFFTSNAENTFVYCNNIKGLINKMGMEYIPGDWRLFIDGSVSGLKVVLLHVLNQKPSIPLAYSTTLKECHDTMVTILDKINYSEHHWKICCDLKVVNILQGILNVVRIFVGSNSLCI